MDEKPRQSAVALAYHAGDAEERRFWERTIAESEQTPEDLPQAIALIERHRAIETTLARAGRFAASAQSALAGFPPSPLRDALLDAADYTLHRAR